MYHTAFYNKTSDEQEWSQNESKNVVELKNQTTKKEQSLMGVTAIPSQGTASESMWEVTRTGVTCSASQQTLPKFHPFNLLYVY